MTEHPVLFGNRLTTLALMMMAVGAAEAANTITRGTWAVFRGSTQVATGLVSEQACVDMIVARTDTGATAYTCREAITALAVPTPPPPPPPAPSPPPPSPPPGSPSPDGSIIGRWDYVGTLTDAQGHKWGHGQFGLTTGVALNVDGGYSNQGADVITIYGGLIWAQHTQGDWYTVVYPGVATARPGQTPGPATPPAPPPPPPPAPPPPAPAPSPPFNISISWSTPLLNTDGTALSDIAGYRVDYGTDQATLNQSMSVPGVGTSSAVISVPASGTYYFRVTTQNSSGASGAPSNRVNITVP